MLWHVMCVHMYVCPLTYGISEMNGWNRPQSDAPPFHLLSQRLPVKPDAPQYG